MKKIAAAAIFVFLTGLFSGIFFSTGISDENIAYLSSVLISSINDESDGFFGTLLSLLFSNFLTAALMLCALLNKKLCPLPLVVLISKSFAIGFCTGLIYLSGIEKPILISLTKMLPPSLFFVPAFIVLSAVSFICSRQELFKTKRPSREKKDLKSVIFICLGIIAAGCIVNAVIL